MHRATHVDETRVLYHLHGRRGNETWWNDVGYYSGDLHAVWSKEEIAAPIVVSVSFGPLWLLTTGREKPGLLELFSGTVIPHVEAELGSSIRERGVVGESMGGLSALMVAVQKPELFEKAAVLCAPVPTDSPHESFLEIWGRAMESSASTHRALMLVSLGRYFFPTEASWMDNDPLTVLGSSSRPKYPSLYITCGATDDWGCMAGSEQAVSLLTKQGADARWVPRPGGHCDIDVESLARFLAEDGEPE